MHAPTQKQVSTVGTTRDVPFAHEQDADEPPGRDPSSGQTGGYLLLHYACSAHADAVTTLRCDRQPQRARVRDRDRGNSLVSLALTGRVLLIIATLCRVGTEQLSSMLRDADAAQHGRVAP